MKYDNKLQITINPIIEFYEQIGKKKSYYIPIVLFLAISYTFSLTNRTISVDDLAQSYYYGSSGVKISTYRWGQVLCNRLFSTIEYTPFINKFIGILFYVLAAFLLSTVLFILGNKDKFVWKYTIFSSVLLTYPLINEICEYYESLTIPFNYAIISLALLFMIQNPSTSRKDYFIVGCVLSIVMSGYESLIFAYITLVFIVLFLQYCVYDSKKGKLCDWIKDGFRYSIPLFIAFATRYVLGNILMKIYNVSFMDFGNTNIEWTRDFWNAFLQLIFNAWYYGIRALSYFPITEFIICTFFYILIVIRLIKEKKNNLSISIFLYMSLFFLPVLQGAHFGYRMAQTIQVFVSFVLYLLLEFTQNNINLRRIMVLFLLFLSLRQSIYLHQLLALNNQRSENEAFIARTIGYNLFNNFDLNKEVIFVGNYQISEDIDSQISIDKNSIIGKFEYNLRNRFGYGDDIYDLNIVSENVLSYLNWSKSSFGSQIMIKKYMSYLGFDIKILDSLSERDLIKYENIAKEHKMKAYDIVDFGNYIIVCLGWNN